MTVQIVALVACGLSLLTMVIFGVITARRAFMLRRQIEKVSAHSALVTVRSIPPALSALADVPARVTHLPARMAHIAALWIELRTLLVRLAP